MVFEREQGASWQDIGAALGISRQTAHERFAEVEQRWKDALRRPWPRPAPAAGERCGFRKARRTPSGGAGNSTHG